MTTGTVNRRSCHEAQKEFIQVAGVADFDPKAKAHASETPGGYEAGLPEIAKDPAKLRRRAREHRAPGQELRPSGRQERGRDKGRGVEKDEGLER